MWWHTATQGKGSEEGNWRMQWVANTLHTTSEHGVSSITTADTHTSAASSRLNWRPPADLNGLANAVGSQYPSHYLGTWCIQHYYRWCAHLGWPQSTELTPPPPADLNGLGPFRAKDEIWFLRVCHHISTGLYKGWWYIRISCVFSYMLWKGRVCPTVLRTTSGKTLGMFLHTLPRHILFFLMPENSFLCIFIVLFLFCSLGRKFHKS